ncbi:hypothetical protein GCM10009737_19560 [Nocardioides lentus]|uniref:DUF4439 domain-containing protein n=1 Tax=Nocardioides lentus TaxID=338077 RepID=A0ABP5AMZ8_9ACTN
MTFLGLARAGLAPRRREAPARLDANAEVAAVRRDLELLETRLRRLESALRDPAAAEGLVAVDGPFAGDAPAAASTAALWLARARTRLEGPRASLAEAHVAAGGLASRW